MGMERREFVKAAALVGAGAAAMGAAVLQGRRMIHTADPSGAETTRQPIALPPESDQGEDVLLRMQRDLARALAKPMEQRRWVMVIDRRKCVGCHACTIGCVAENKLPPGVVYRPVMTTESGQFPNLRLSFLPRPCMQCERPPCVPVCPVKATWKRADGVVVIDYDKCIGCRYCLTACPYGARTSDFGQSYTEGTAEAERRGPSEAVLSSPAAWEKLPNREYGKSWDRAGHGSPIGNARKCHFCLHRLDVGQLPMCVSTCIGRATYFGDSTDPESLVAELRAAHDMEVLLPHQETEPAVFYII